MKNSPKIYECKFLAFFRVRYGEGWQGVYDMVKVRANNLGNELRRADREQAAKDAHRMMQLSVTPTQSNTQNN